MYPRVSSAKNEYVRYTTNAAAIHTSGERTRRFISMWLSAACGLNPP